MGILGDRDDSRFLDRVLDATEIMLGIQPTSVDREPCVVVEQRVIDTNGEARIETPEPPADDGLDKEIEKMAGEVDRIASRLLSK
jgi:hypothetical protein